MNIQKNKVNYFIRIKYNILKYLNLKPSYILETVKYFTNGENFKNFLSKLTK